MATVMRRVLRITAIGGLVGLALSVIAIATDPRRALLAYLMAYVTVAAAAIGGLVLLLAGYATNARWLAPLRRHQESLAIVFPVLAVLFVPIAVGLEHIYVWADPSAELPPAEKILVDAKRAWLDPTGFVVRSAIYLAIFVVAAEVLRGWSRRRDRTTPAGDPERAMARERAFAAAMLPPVGLALTFAAIDWVMSLQPAWLSSMFGVYFFAGGFGAGIAVLALLARHIPHPAITPHHFHAIGRLLLAFVVFWTYTAYFQGFLIQIADRPNEVTFFIVRTRAGWDYVLIALIAARFVIPFLLLLPRRLKLRPHYVAGVAVIALIGHVLDIYWLVIPTTAAPFSPHWADLVALVGIASTCIAFAVWRQRGVPAVVAGDPFVEQGTRYESPT